MTTDAEVQTVVYIPVKKPAEPRPEKTEEEVRVSSGKAEEVLYGTARDAKGT